HSIVQTTLAVVEVQQVLDRKLADGVGAVRQWRVGLARQLGFGNFPIDGPAGTREDHELDPLGYARLEQVDATDHVHRDVERRIANTDRYARLCCLMADDRRS